MARKRVTLRYRKERSVLTDVLPYEVPLIFSNRRLYAFLCENRIASDGHSISWIKGSVAINRIIHLLFSLPDAPHRLTTESRFFGPKIVQMEKYDLDNREPKPSPRIDLKPFGYKIDHKEVEFRQLTIPHPRSQLHTIDFYDRYKETILYYCSTGDFSIRRPARIARFTYHKDRTHYERLADEVMPIEQHDHEYEDIKSFFVYRDYSNVYKFYESRKYHRCEMKYNAMAKLDISKCFDSIYTHSIAWAIYGKEVIKENVGPSQQTFPGHFDRLMQRINYNETNGIIIGPELSRLFAEIILQSIDKSLESDLRKLPRQLKHKVDYEIFRYVDDYFIFYNHEDDRKVIEQSLQIRLKEFGLSLNIAKGKIYSKPIITEISRAKRRISMLFNQRLVYDLEALDGSEDKKSPLRGSISIDCKSLIIEFKTIIRECEVTYHELLNYSLASLESRIEGILKAFSRADKEHRNHKSLLKAIESLIEFVFFIYSVSPRANPTIKLCRILRMICCFLQSKSIQKEERQAVTKAVFDQISIVLRRNRSDEYTQIETLNLLIALIELGREYRLDEDVLAGYFNIGRAARGGGYEPRHDLNYFSLIVLLFYMSNKTRYRELREFVEKYIEDKIEARRGTLAVDTECVLLMLDTVACPYVSVDLKRRLLAKYGVTDPVEVNEVIELKAKNGCRQRWFVVWDEFDYGRELDRKKGLEVY